MILRLGSRDSELAATQAESVAGRLEELDGVRVDAVTTDTLGDREADRDLASIGQIGVFTAELDELVLSGDLDAAVHSLKDCPVDLPEGLVVAAVPPRTTPFDTLVGLEERPLSALEDGTGIGTSSRRRRANLLACHPGLSVHPCRGNVPTRLEKLETEDRYDALVLAAAGLERLDRGPTPARLLSTDEMLPAPGQGALAVTCRAEDTEVRSVLEAIDHGPSRRVCSAERAFLSAMGGGCQTPIGALGTERGGELQLLVSVTDPEGDRRLEESWSGPPGDALQAARTLAEGLLDRGAGKLIEP